MQHETSNVERGSVETMSLAIPAVMRAGGDGKIIFINQNIYQSFLASIDHCLNVTSTNCLFLLYCEKLKQAFRVIRELDENLSS